MRKNVASQIVGAQLVSASDGSAFTGAVTVSVTGDGGTQATGSVGAGACTHEGNGFHTYAPAQAETNYDHVAFTFTGTGAVPVTVQVYTSFPQTGDSFARIGANGAGLTDLATAAALATVSTRVLLALPAVAAGANGGLPLGDANGDVAVGGLTVAALSQFVLEDFGVLPDGVATGSVAHLIFYNVWEQLKADHATPGTFGDYLDDEVSSRSSHAAADVVTALGTGSTLTALATQASVTTLSTAVADVPTNAELTAALADLPTNAELATALTTTTVLADVRKVNNVTITGTGVLGDEWGPA